MTLGTQPLSCGAKPRSNRFLSVRGIAAVLLMLSVLGLLAGCGGGSGSSPGPNTTPSPNATNSATITGRVVDRYAGNSGVDGITLTFDNGGTPITTTTSGGGNFTFTVSAGLGSRALRVNVPTGLYYDNAQVQGTTYAISSQGIAVPTLTAGQTYQLGEIAIASFNGGPPPPPVFPPAQ